MIMNRGQQIFEIPGFMNTSTEEYDETPSMERIKHFSKLIKDADKIWDSMSRNRKIYPLLYFSFLRRKLKKYVKKGVKVLEKKIPIYVEMPKYKKVGNGQVKKEYDKRYPQPKEETVEVGLPTVAETTVVPHQDTLK